MDIAFADIVTCVDMNGIHEYMNHCHLWFLSFGINEPLDTTFDGGV